MLRSIPLCILLCWVSACATIFARDTRSIMVTSNPPGAEILVNGKPGGVTPTRISVNDHERLEVTMSKPGYKSGGCYINTSIGAMWVIVDVLLIYTVVPLVVDLVTGQWSSLDSEYCTVELTPGAAAR